MSSRSYIALAGCSTAVSTIALQAGTQLVAWWYGNSSNLGAPLFEYDGAAIYAPWMLVRWYLLWPELFPIKLGLLVAVSVVAFVAYCAYRNNALPWQRKKDDVLDAPEWGTEKDLRKADLLHKDGPYGIVLGMLPDGRLVTYRGGAHVLLQGGTGTGKTVSGVLPGILCLDHDSLLVLDTKGENYDTTARYRATLGPCAFFDPTNPDSVRINPFSVIRFEADFEDMDVANLCKLIVARTGTSGTDSTGRYYQQRVRPVLEAMVRHSFYDVGVVPSGGSLRRMLPGFEASTLKAMLKSKVRSVVDAAKAFEGMAADSRKGTLDGLADVLAVFGDRLVDRATSESDFAINDIMAADKPWTLYLRSPQSDQDRLQPLMMMITRQIIGKLMFKLTACDDSRLKLRTLTLVMEEFADSDLSFIKDKLVTMRGFGMRAILVAQSNKLLKEVYGPLNSIDENCAAIVTYANIGQDEQTYISGNAGQRIETVERVTRKHGVWITDPERSVSTAAHKSPLLTRADVRAIPDDRQHVTVRGVKPTFLLLKPEYYKHPQLSKRGDNCVAHPELRPGQQQWVLDRRAAAKTRISNMDLLKQLTARRGWSADDLAAAIFPTLKNETVRKWIAGSLDLPPDRRKQVEALLAEDVETEAA